jgi:hypothetical protein
MELHGITGAPYKHPQVRRTTPVFQRQRIDLDGGRRVRRTWQDTAVCDLKKGDTVPGLGTVESTVEFISVERADEGLMPWRIRVYNVFGEYKDFPGEQRLFAFAAEKPHG